jgi:tetratricopeptide (TPR) repeat protein
MYEGFSYKFVPIKSRMSRYDIGFSDPYDLYHKMKNVYKWDALKRTDYFVDYHNLYTFCGVLSQRQIFVNVANELIEVEEYDKAVEILDMCQECVPEEKFPYEMIYMGFSNEYDVLKMVETYYNLGERQKAEAILYKFVDRLKESREFFRQFENSQDTFENINSYLSQAMSLYMKEISYLISEQEGELAKKNLDRAYSWLTVSDFPTDAVWYDFILYYAILEQYDQAEMIAEDYSVSLLSELNELHTLYNVTVDAYIKTYSRYEKTEDEGLIPQLQKHENLLGNLEDMLKGIEDSMKSLHGLVVELERDDLAEMLQKSLDLFE